jgi:hypothetical protein
VVRPYSGTDLIVRPEGSAQFSVVDLFNRVVALEAVSTQHGLDITNVTADIKIDSEKVSQKSTLARYWRAYCGVNEAQFSSVLLSLAPPIC